MYTDFSDLPAFRSASLSRTAAVYECEAIKNLILKLIKAHLKHLESYRSHLRLGVHGALMSSVVT